MWTTAETKGDADHGQGRHPKDGGRIRMRRDGAGRRAAAAPAGVGPGLRAIPRPALAWGSPKCAPVLSPKCNPVVRRNALPYCHRNALLYCHRNANLSCDLSPKWAPVLPRSGRSITETPACRVSLHRNASLSCRLQGRKDAVA